jgi:hypothetical protein
MSTTLYASIDGRVSPLANQEVVFYDPRRDECHVMTVQVLQALDLCRPFRTLDGHAAELGRRLEGLSGREDAIRRVLESLVARGLLVSDQHWMAQLCRGSRREPAPLAAIFIHADGSPDRLRALLRGLLDYEQAFGPGHRYVVIDGGDDSGAESARRELLEAFAAEAEVRAYFLGARAREALVAALAADAAGDVLADLLPSRGRCGPGTARNLATLLSAGRRYLLIDDARLLPFHGHGGNVRELDAAARGAAAAITLFPGIEEALAHGRPMDDDPLHAHLQACGAQLGDLVNVLPGFELGRDALASIEPSRMPRLRAETPVLATAIGRRGGRAPGPWLFQLDAAGRAELATDRDRYLSLIESPAVLEVPPRVSLRAPGEVPAFLIDNSLPIPCAPIRGTDGQRLFGSLMRAMHPQAVCAVLPVSLGAAADRSDGGWLKRPLTASLNRYLGDLAARYGSEVAAEAPWSRLGALASRMQDLADASDAALRIELREYHAFLRSSLIQALQQAYEQGAAAAPVHWQADLRQLIESNGRALIDGGDPRLADTPSGEGAESGLRAALRALARTLGAWPALWEQARAGAERLWKHL